MRARHLAWATTAMTAGLAVGTVAFGFQNDGTPLPADEGEEIVSFAGELAYRLYDLGRIVNRTLVYGGLTLMLAATYLGLVRGTGHRRARDGATRPSDVVGAPVTMPGRGATRMRT